MSFLTDHVQYITNDYRMAYIENDRVLPPRHVGGAPLSFFRWVGLGFRKFSYHVLQAFCCCCVDDVDISMLDAERRIFYNVDLARNYTREHVVSRLPVEYDAVYLRIDTLHVVDYVNKLVLRLGHFDPARDNRLVVGKELRRIYKDDNVKDSVAVHHMEYVIEAYFRCRSNILKSGVYRRRNNRMSNWLGYGVDGDCLQ